MSGTVFGEDDQVGSSHDADVDAGYDDDQPASDLSAGSDLDAGGAGSAGQTSAEADVDAAYDDDGED